MVSIVGLFFSTSVLRGGSMRTVGYYLLRTVSIVGLYGVYRGFLAYKNTPVSIDENSMHNKKNWAMTIISSLSSFSLATTLTALPLPLVLPGCEWLQSCLFLVCVAFVVAVLLNSFYICLLLCGLI